jgi:hypothetical protein
MFAAETAMRRVVKVAGSIELPSPVIDDRVVTQFEIAMTHSVD